MNLEQVQATGRSVAPEGASAPLRFLRRLATVRWRASIVSVLVVGATFALGSLAVVSVVRSSLYQSATNAAKAEALDLSSLEAARGHISRRIPNAEEQAAAQIVSSSGSVLASTRNVAGQAAMVDLRPAPNKLVVASGITLEVRRFTSINLHLDAKFVVAAVRMPGGQSAPTVLVAYSLGAADHAVNVLETSLSLTVPLLALLVGALVWWLTGWALRPVEAIRARVAELSATDLSQRLPAPATTDEVGQLARTMNDLLGRLQAANDRQRQLIADVSHELRNPLAALQAELEVAREHPRTTGRSMLEASMTEVARMSQLVDDMLTLARIDEGMLRLRPGDVDLDELVLDEAERMRARSGLEISTEGVSAARITGDEAQLRRAVTNLADNARRHARSRTRFAVRRAGQFQQLIVEDDGPGVPWYEREHIFERFVRLDAARPHDGTGAGLGLAIVREIVSAHGGSVWVEDAEPGARFVVNLPATRDS